MQHKHEPSGFSRWVLDTPTKSIQECECRCGATLTRETAPLDAKYNWKEWATK